MSSLRAKNPSSTSRSVDESFAMPVTGREKARCGSGAGALGAKLCAVKVRAPESPHASPFQRAIAHHQRTRNQVAQPLMARRVAKIAITPTA